MVFALFPAQPARTGARRSRQASKSGVAKTGRRNKSCTTAIHPGRACSALRHVFQAGNIRKGAFGASNWLIRKRGTEVTGRARNRDLCVVLRAIKSGRASRAALLARVRVEVPSQTLHRAAGPISAVRPCIANATIDDILRSRCHRPSSANVTSRALAELPITSSSNTGAVMRGAQSGSITHNARHQSIGGGRVPAMYVVRGHATSTRTSERLKRNNTSHR